MHLKFLEYLLSNENNRFVDRLNLIDEFDLQKLTETIGLCIASTFMTLQHIYKHLNYN